MNQKNSENNKLFLKRKHPLEGKMFCGKIQVDPGLLPPIETASARQATSARETTSGSETQTPRVPFTSYQLKTRNTGELDYSTTYAPAGFYRNLEKPLASKIKRFLSNPPFNSDEYLQKRGRPAIEDSEFGDSQPLDQSFLSSEEDQLSESLKLVLPERRTIHSMVLPPIHENCTQNFSDKYTVNDESLFDNDLDDFEKVRFCTYLRESKFSNASSDGAGYTSDNIRKHLHSR